jgi:hypothetical protein
MVSHQRETIASFCDYNDTPVGMHSTLRFYLDVAKNSNEYGYIRQYKAFLRWGIGYIGVYRECEEKKEGK